MMVRDIPVFREVAGESAYYFFCPESAALALSVLEWLTLNEQGRAPLPHEMKWITWAEGAAQLVESLNLKGAPHTSADRTEQACQIVYDLCFLLLPPRRPPLELRRRHRHCKFMPGMSLPMSTCCIGMR